MTKTIKKLISMVMLVAMMASFAFVLPVSAKAASSNDDLYNIAAGFYSDKNSQTWKRVGAVTPGNKDVNKTVVISGQGPVGVDIKFTADSAGKKVIWSQNNSMSIAKGKNQCSKKYKFGKDHSVYYVWVRANKSSSNYGYVASGYIK